jgi:hypothetical protein
MTWKLACSVALALMPGWALAQNSDAMAKSASKLIAARLVDPDSIVLRNTRVVSATSPSGAAVTLLCGEYNARNRIGGYAGFRSFIYEPSEMQGVMAFGEDMTFMSADGRSDYSADAIKNLSVDPNEMIARFDRLEPFLMAYWDPCRGAA